MVPQLHPSVLQRAIIRVKELEFRKGSSCLQHECTHFLWKLRSYFFPSLICHCLVHILGSVEVVKSSPIPMWSILPRSPLWSKALSEQYGLDQCVFNGWVNFEEMRAIRIFLFQSQWLLIPPLMFSFPIINVTYALSLRIFQEVRNIQKNKEE